MSKEEMQVHSALGPSSGDRWLNCPGSVKATADLPDVTSIFAAEGTFAHLISELMRDPEVDNDDIIGFTDTVDGFEFTVDQSMFDYIKEFVDYVQQHEYEQELVEARVHYNAWVEGGFGTLDAGMLSDGTCGVVDLKYGKGVQVFAEDNTQLKLYALGIYQEYCHLYEITDFKLVIHQPRLRHVDEWSITVPDLIKWADEVVEPAADLALSDGAPFKAGKWCQFCKLRGTCRTRAETLQAAMLDEISEVRDPAEMTNDELGAAMSMVSLMEKWCKEITASVNDLVLKGEKIIGDDGLPFKMVVGRAGNASWVDPERAEKAMRNYKMKVSDIFTRKLISPTECIKILGKNHPMLLEKANHIKRSKGKPTLVPGSDPRPAYAEADVDELGDVE